jgi:2-polyprenyl-3-methyl-5-hydroxy-6-metoxy-1,4-benzoquinol methylase
VGSKQGAFAGRAFELRRCDSCGLSYVADPWTDYARIYDEAYYEGRGADPMIDYAFELAHEDRTVRTHEWSGIERLVGSCVPLSPQRTWVDYGCGHGGLVRHVARGGRCRIVGFEQGAIVKAARAAGVEVLGEEELGALDGKVDVVTALDVLEHTTDPVGVLRRIRRLLRPGGLLFATTANAAPFRDRIVAWNYVIPEIHVSFFEPRTLAVAFEKAGFRAEYPGWLPGMTDVMRSKILKNLRVRERAAWQSLVPWSVLARAADRVRALSALPIAWAV